MIKHTESQLVPFEDCGFARYPEMPLSGEEVILRCRIAAGDPVPVLSLESGRGSAEIAAQSVRDGICTYRAGAFHAGDSVRYRFVTASESTPEYSFSPVSAETCERPVSAYFRQDCLTVRIAPDIVLTACSSAAKPLTLSLLQTEPCSGTGLSGPVSLAGLLLETREDTILTVSASGSTLFSINACTLWRDGTGKVVKASLRLASGAKHIFGTGERFDAADQYGRGTCGSVNEKFTHQGDQTYLPVPFFMTETGWGWYQASDIPAAMCFSESGITLTQETEGTELMRAILLRGTPAEILRGYLDMTGPCVLPPEWAFGVWISGNGWNCDREVEQQLQALRENDYPASVMVLEQWSDERTFYIWHPDRFPQPEKTVAGIRAAGLHPVLWQIPVVKYEWDGETGAELARDTREALERGLIVKREDGTPYRITERWFHHSLLPDFTNPETVEWWFSKRKYLLDMGVEGFKTDGGEFLFDKRTRLHDGTSGKRAHNLYPVIYETAYHEFLKKNAVSGVLFSRAGYTGAQSVPIHWAGDQVSEWSELQAQLTAGISAGLSGILFWGFDIGGFAGPIPTPELYLRATAMACFSPIMQWHSEPRGGQFSGGAGEAYNNDRSPWNLAEKWKDPSLLRISCDFAREREKLRPYLAEEAAYCAAHRRPLMAHLCIDWPEDPAVYEISDEYMLGRKLLVAPVTGEGVTGRDVYLPEGSWTGYYDGLQYRGNTRIRISCPLNSIPVFIKERDTSV